MGQNKLMNVMVRKARIHVRMSEFDELLVIDSEQSFSQNTFVIISMIQSVEGKIQLMSDFIIIHHTILKLHQELSFITFITSLGLQYQFDSYKTFELKMARNCEKAQGMLNRWWTMKKMLVNKEEEERPRGLRHIREINDLYECEKWRKQVTTNIIEKVEEIQNRARPENETRSLNDEINRLLRQLYHWEIRIKQLGGNDYRSIKNAKMYDSQGHEIPGFGGYRYFGAAKDLPGVKDTFRRQAPTAPQKTKDQLRKVIDEQYFGDQQTLDSQLLKQQQLEQESKRQGELVQWIEQNKKKIQQFFNGREPQFDELMENIDNIEDFQVQLQEQDLQQKFGVKDEKMMNE